MPSAKTNLATPHLITLILNRNQFRPNDHFSLSFSRPGTQTLPGLYTSQKEYYTRIGTNNTRRTQGLGEPVARAHRTTGALNKASVLNKPTSLSLSFERGERERKRSTRAIQASRSVRTLRVCIYTYTCALELYSVFICARARPR